MCTPEILLGTTTASGTALPGLFGVGGEFSLATTLSTSAGLLSGVTAYQTAQAQSKAAAYSAQVAERQAQDALARGREEEQRKRMQVRRMIGTQKARLGANLVDVSSGTPSDLVADTAMLGELDALTVRNNAEREAWGYRAQAGAKRYESDQYRTKSYLNLAGGLLDVATPVASKWYDHKSELTRSRDYGP
ncbi:MAG: hypothetical protein D6698_15615 [Gammaproteobacteria bacterium]|nr:MAG: hypothetical protein D6698_15615 [Gammaproteobacteria bacterium]